MASTSDSSSHCFAFEQDFIGTWRCIPLCVRRKLDLAGVKFKLSHWLALTQNQRQELVDWSDAADALDQLRQHLRDLTEGMTDGVVKDLPPAVDAAWQQQSLLPVEIHSAAVARGVELTPEQWAQVSELDRFAMCRLVRAWS